MKRKKIISSLLALLVAFAIVFAPISDALVSSDNIAFAQNEGQQTETRAERIARLRKILEEARLRKQADNEPEYLVNDFTFEGTTITGFSQKGLIKFESNKNLVLPSKTPDGQIVTAIGSKAFIANSRDYSFIGNVVSNPNGVKSLTLPEGLIEIGSEAFRYNAIEGEVVFPETLEKIGNMAFHSNALTLANLPDSLIELGTAVFGTNQITRVDTSKGLKVIPAGSFTNNNPLKEIVLYQGLETIGLAAFMSGSLTEVHLPHSLNSVGFNSFANNNTVVKLYTENPNHLAFNTDRSANNHLVVLSVDESEEYTVDDFTFEGTTITGFSESGLGKFAENKDVVLPSQTPDGETVTAIGESAFEATNYTLGADSLTNPNGIKSLVLPEGLVEIGASAFRWNEIRGVVEFPETLSTIGDFAFHGNGLRSVDLPNSITTLGTSAFALNQLTSVDLSSGLKSTGNSTFARNLNLSDVKLYDGLEVIGRGVFHTSSISEITIPSTVTTIEGTAFFGHKLVNLEIPSSVTSIGNEAFRQRGSKTLENITFNEGLLSIGTSAFRDASVSEATLPNSLESLAYNAFEANVGVVQLYTGNEEHLAFNTDRSAPHHLVIVKEPETQPAETSDFVVDENGVLTAYTGTDTDILIPSEVDGITVTEIGKEVFSRKNLTAVEIPNTVTYIGEGAFLNNNLTEVIIPGSVQGIGRLSFGLNPALTTVNLEEGFAVLGQQAFLRSAIKEITLPSTTTRVFASSFQQGQLETIHIRGNENSAELDIGSSISDKLTTINIENPGKKAYIAYNVSNAPRVDVNIGSLEYAGEVDDLQVFLDENVNPRKSAYYVNMEDSSGGNDKRIISEIDWELAGLDLANKPIKVTGRAASFGDIPPITGYSSPNPDNVTLDMIFNLNITE